MTVSSYQLCWQHIISCLPENNVTQHLFVILKKRFYCIICPEEWTWLYSLLGFCILLTTCSLFSTWCKAHSQGASIRLDCGLNRKEWGSLNFLFGVLMFSYKRTQLLLLAAVSLIYRLRWAGWKGERKVLTTPSPLEAWCLVIATQHRAGDGLTCRATRLLPHGFLN